MRKSLLSLLSVSCLWFSACAGHKINYLDAKPNLAVAGSLPVTVATLDQRPDTSKDTFVGLNRDGFGIPYPMGTDSRRPLSDDMTEVMTAALAEKGFAVHAVATAKSETEAVVLSRMIATKSTRLILLRLRNWYSDTMRNTALHYDATLAVYDGSGNPLGEKMIKGDDNLGVNDWTFPSLYAKEALPKAFARKLEELFAAPEIEKNLR